MKKNIRGNEIVEIVPEEFYPVNLYNLVGSEGDHNTRVDVNAALRKDIENHVDEQQRKKEDHD